MILHRRAGERFSEVAREWPGATVVLIGGGPSLSPAQLELVCAARAAEAVRCIAVNDGYLAAPFSDVCYFADSHWWHWHTHGIPKPAIGMTAEDVRGLFAAFRGQKCTIENSGANVTDDAVHMLRNRNFNAHADGLSLDPRALMTGRNSGFQALNLAVLAGATSILLLGFDGQVGADGRTHWHGDHPRPTPDAAYPLYRQAMAAVSAVLQEACIRVVNCSPASAIDSFESMPLEEALCGVTA